MPKIPITLHNDFHNTSTMIRVEVNEILSLRRVRAIRDRLCGSDDCICGDFLGRRGPQESSERYDFEQIDDQHTRFIELGQAQWGGAREGAGRPPLPEKDRRQSISTTLSQEIVRLLDERAREQQDTRSETIAALIEAEFEYVLEGRYGEEEWEYLGHYRNKNACAEAIASYPLATLYRCSPEGTGDSDYWQDGQWIDASQMHA